MISRKSTLCFNTDNHALKKQLINLTNYKSSAWGLHAVCGLFTSGWDCYEEDRKNHVFKTGQYCSCAHPFVDIHLNQVDWRGWAPQNIQCPWTRRKCGNRPKKRISKSFESPTRNPMSINFFIFSLSPFKKSAWTGQFSTAVDKPPKPGKFPGKFTILKTVKLLILLRKYTLFVVVDLLGKLP